MSELFNTKLDDSNSELQSSGGGSRLNFGLNQGLTFSNLGYELLNDKEDSDPYHVFNYSVKIGEDEEGKPRERYARFYIPKVGDPVYSSGNLLNKDDKGYEEAFKSDAIQKFTVAVHAVKAVGVKQEDIDKVADNSKNYLALAKNLSALIPDNYKDKKIDVFGEYEWNIKDGNDKTYVILPKNMKGGYFLCSAQEGNFSSVEEGDELVYVNDKGVEHPFTRNANYMDSNKANQQILGGSGDSIDIEESDAETADWGV